MPNTAPHAPAHRALYPKLRHSTRDIIVKSTIKASRSRAERNASYAQLREHEVWWRDRQKWLEEKGYMLRPRYRPGWKPSWEGKNVEVVDCEDSVATFRGHLMDAKRIADGEIVVLKKISDRTHAYEADISRIFSVEPHASHPQNHCIRIYEILDVPGEDHIHILVMPLLREFNDPAFETVGEIVDFFSQIFEGLQYMHHCHIAHRDCMDLNIMMDPVPLYPSLYHPQEPLLAMDFKHLAKHYTRTSRPTRYYLIDFGLSRIYDPLDGPPRELPIWGGDKTVPEFHISDDPCDPFPTDIYYLGNMVRECFLEQFDGVEFMASLVEDMVQDDPVKRPTIDEVVRRFKEIQQSLSQRKLRSRLPEKGEFGLYRVYQATMHAFRTMGYVMTRRSAIPSR